MKLFGFCSTITKKWYFDFVFKEDGVYFSMRFFEAKLLLLAKDVDCLSQKSMTDFDQKHLKVKLVTVFHFKSRSKLAENLDIRLK